MQDASAALGYCLIAPGKLVNVPVLLCFHPKQKELVLRGININYYQMIFAFVIKIKAMKPLLFTHSKFTKGHLTHAEISS